MPPDAGELLGGVSPIICELTGACWTVADDGAAKLAPQLTQKVVPGVTSLPQDEHLRTCSLPQYGQNLLFSVIS